MSCLLSLLFGAGFDGCLLKWVMFWRRYIIHNSKHWCMATCEALWLVLSKLGVPEPTIKLIRSFRCDMQAQIRLNDMMLEPINASNGFRQGCSMAPFLFNLYSSLVIERWHARVSSLEDNDWGIYRKLFRWYTRNAEEVKVSEYQFADDVALLATTKRGAELITTYLYACRQGLWAHS